MIQDHCRSAHSGEFLVISSTICSWMSVKVEEEWEVN